MTGTPILSRRALVLGLSALGIGVGVKPGSAALPVPTPAQTEGPFYPVSLPPDADADLIRSLAAKGPRLELSGTVRRLDGTPLAGALVEIWQCDAQGRYRHPRAPENEAFDPAFKGYGRTTTDEEGRYRFRTIRPAPYPGRTPHIHLAVIGSGKDWRFVTQMYVAGERQNERDFLLAAVRDPRARDRLIVTLDPDRRQAGAFVGQFDLFIAV